MSIKKISANELLASLPADVYEKLIPKFDNFELRFGQTLYAQGDIFSHVYFPESGIVSILASDSDSTLIEVAMVGREGMAPPPAFLNIKKSTCDAHVQGDGSAHRMKIEDFLAECAEGEDLSRVMKAFTYAVILQLTRAAICNRFHSTESRLARWLLMTRDRMSSDTFRVTQEFLSYMVGVRREAVNKAAGNFARRDLISYSRGEMSIDDRKGLKAIACNCYEMMLCPDIGGVPVNALAAHIA